MKLLGEERMVLISHRSRVGGHKVGLADRSEGIQESLELVVGNLLRVRFHRYLRLATFWQHFGEVTTWLSGQYPL